MQEQQGKPLVSVVMATYNGERFLDEQLLSIRNQTYTTLEIIVVDDASTDSTLDILRRHAAQDERIQIHVNAGNQGTTTTFERGFGLAQGEFVAISDQDDVWLPEKIAVLLDRIQNHDAIYTDSELIDGNGRSLGISLLQKLGVDNPVSGRDALKLLHKNCVSGHAMLLRKEVVTKALPLSRDADFIYDQQLALVAMLGGGLFFHAISLTQHRVHNSNQVNRFDATVKLRKNPVARRTQARLRARVSLTKQCGAKQKISNNEAYRLIEKLDRHFGSNVSGFNFKLFFFLIPLRKRLFFASKKNAIILCFRLSRNFVSDV